MTQELVYYTSTDAHICRDWLQKQGFTATVIPTPLVRSRSTYRGTIEEFRTLLTLAVRYDYALPEAKDLLQLELASLKHFLEKTENLLAAFFETHPAGSIVPATEPAGDPAVLGPSDDAGYLQDILKDNGIVAPGTRTVIAHLPVAECRIDRPSIGLETLAPDLLAKSGLTVVTEHLVEYRFVVTTNADSATRASCSRLIGMADSTSCCSSANAQIQAVKTGILERIQNTAAELSLTDIMHLLGQPVRTAHHREECYRLPREFLKIILYELGLFKLD
ncbi:MAG TPA: hypothetical protein O0X27_06875 [Methanocorpusculum sp.]|nr:hypothetical protein [Methanocorpusculum sp.]